MAKTPSPSVLALRKSRIETSGFMCSGLDKGAIGKSKCRQGPTDRAASGVDACHLLEDERDATPLDIVAADNGLGNGTPEHLGVRCICHGGHGAIFRRGRIQTCVREQDAIYLERSSQGFE